MRPKTSKTRRTSTVVRRGLLAVYGGIVLVLLPATALATGPDQRSPQPEYGAKKTDTRSEPVKSKAEQTDPRKARDEAVPAKPRDKASTAAVGHTKPTGGSDPEAAPPVVSAVAVAAPHTSHAASGRTTTKAASPALTGAAAGAPEAASVVAAAQSTDDQAPSADQQAASVVDGTDQQISQDLSDPQVNDTKPEDAVEPDLADESQVAEDASAPAAVVTQQGDRLVLASAPDEAESADQADGVMSGEVASDPQPVEHSAATAEAMDSAPADAQVGAQEGTGFDEPQDSVAYPVGVAAGTVEVHLAPAAAAAIAAPDAEAPAAPAAIAAPTAEARPAPVAIAAPILSPPAVLALSVRDAVAQAPRSATEPATALIAILGLILFGWVVHRSTRIARDVLAPLWVVVSPHLPARLTSLSKWWSNAGQAPRPSRVAAAGALTILGGLLAIGLWLRSLSAPALASSPPRGSSAQASADVPTQAFDPALLSPVEVSASADPNEAQVGKVVTVRLRLTNHGTTQLWGTDIATDGPWDAYEALSSGSNAVLVYTPNGWTIQTRLPIPVGESRDVVVALVPRKAGDQHFSFVATGHDFLGKPVGPPSFNPTAPGV